MTACTIIALAPRPTGMPLRCRICGVIVTTKATSYPHPIDPFCRAHGRRRFWDDANGHRVDYRPALLDWASGTRYGARAAGQTETAGRRDGAAS